MPSGTKILCWREKWHSQRRDFVWVFNFDTYFHFKRKAIRNVCFTFFSHIFPSERGFSNFQAVFIINLIPFFILYVFIMISSSDVSFFLSTILPSIPYSCVLPSSSFTSDILSLSVNWWHSLFYIPSTHYLLFIVCVLCTLVWLPEIYVDCTIIPRLLCNILIACLII